MPGSLLGRKCIRNFPTTINTHAKQSAVNDFHTLALLAPTCSNDSFCIQSNWLCAKCNPIETINDVSFVIMK